MKGEKMIRDTKRAAAVITAVALFLFLIPIRTLATAVTSVQGANVQVRPGEKIDFPISISGNPGLTGFTIYVSCDTNIFSVDYDSDNSSYAVTAGQGFESGSVLCAKNGTKGWIVTWYSSTPASTDGELFHLRFTVDKEASAGAYPIKLACNEKNTLDINYDSVKVSCIDGSVNVAPKTGIFRIGDIQAVPGGDINVPVYVDANPGFATCKLYIDCDPELFVADYINDTKQCSITAGELAQGGLLICSRNGKNGYQIVWQSTTDKLGSGELFTFPLRISPQVLCGDHSLSLRLDTGSLLNQRSEKVTASAVSGTLHIRECIADNFRYSAADGAKVDLCVGTGQSVCVVCAIYSERGQMLELQSISQQGPFSGTKEFSFSANGNTAKLFILNSQSFVPILTACEQ